jgi:UPF0716 protein FxsA
MIFVLFLAVPLVEIALFITVGGWLSLWPTLALVVLTAIVGSFMVRLQGLGVLRQIQSSLDAMRDPTGPVAHGLMILIAGVMLITPGFFTDTIGFALLVPGLRQWIIKIVAARLVAGHRGGAAQPMARDDIIEAEFREVPPDTPHLPGTDNPRSGWTRT